MVGDALPASDGSNSELVVGVDLVSVQGIADSVARFGDKFVKRVFTPGEIAYCREKPGAEAERFAARFAAKEATMKALRPTPDDALPWQSIEIERAPGGWCSVRLSGNARALADERGIHGLVLSFSHERDYATATVIGHRSRR